MAKKNKDDYVEKLERELKDLKGVNRQLMRRLKKLDRNFKAVEELTSQDREADEKEVAREEKKKMTRCPSCHDGGLVTIEVMGRSIRKCGTCTYREKAIKT